MSDKIGIISRYSTEVISAMRNLKITRGGGGGGVSGFVLYHLDWLAPTSNRMALS